LNSQALQTILCRAAVDGAFLAALLSAPRRTLQGYALSAAELDVLAEPGAESLTELAAAVETWRRGEPRRVAVAEFALAR